MIIIGEKINGTIKSVGNAIRERDRAFIQNLAIKQAEAGANYLDICAGTDPKIEVEVLKWLINVVQDAVDVPICLDSPSPEVIENVIPWVRKIGLINSTSGEGDKSKKIYPIVKKSGCSVIALTLDDNGIPNEVATRLEIARSLILKAKDYGIAEEKLFIDPLVVALSTDNQSMLKFVEVLRNIKAEYPRVNIISGLSNISFGMPRRKIINRHFMSIALYEGMESAIMDPLDRDIMGTIQTIQALMGKDRHCRHFLNAFRKEQI